MCSQSKYHEDEAAIAEFFPDHPCRVHGLSIVELTWPFVGEAYGGGGGDFAIIPQSLILGFGRVVKTASPIVSEADGGGGGDDGSFLQLFIFVFGEDAFGAGGGGGELLQLTLINSNVPFSPAYLFIHQ